MRWADVMMLRTATLWLVGSWRVASGGDSADIVPDGQFETLSYARIVQEIQDLATDYPQLAQVLVETTYSLEGSSQMLHHTRKQ